MLSCAGSFPVRESFPRVATRETSTIFSSVDASDHDLKVWMEVCSSGLLPPTKMWFPLPGISDCCPELRIVRVRSLSHSVSPFSAKQIKRPCAGHKLDTNLVGLPETWRYAVGRIHRKN